jgi:hypothetical protein
VSLFWGTGLKAAAKQSHTRAEMFRRLLLLLPLVAGSIYDCDNASVFRPTALALNPDPPVRGKPVTMTVLFNNPGETVYDGKVVTTMSLNGIPFSPSTEALCENTECPILTGSNDRSAVSTWPDSVSGKVTSKSQWFDATGNSLLCVQTKVTVAETQKPKGLRGGLWYLLEQMKHDVAETGMVTYRPFRWGSTSSTSGGSSGGSETTTTGGTGGSGGGSTGGGETTGSGSTGSGSSDDSTGGSVPSYAPRPSKRPHPRPTCNNATMHDEL